MFSSVVAALALAASVSRVAASPINHVARGYAQDADLLEDYTPYHVRYLALDCQDKHNTEFFDQCCHPLLRSQKLSERPAQCTPSPSASASAAIAEPPAPPVDEDPLPAADECDDDEDEEECEDDITSTAPASTAKPTPTHKPATTASAMITSYVAPASKPTSAPVTTPVPETTPAPETTTHRPSSTRPVTSAEPVTSATPSNGGGELFKGGFATFFEQGGVAGACGDVHSDNDLVVAADFRRYGPLNAKSDLCGKKVRITNTDNGKTVVAIIADACPSCVSKNSLDLSHGAYDKIGARETGMLPIEWQFI